MRKKSQPIGILHMTKAKFAVSANLLIMLIIAHNIVSAVLGYKDMFSFALFLAAFVYFLSSASYSLYFDLIEK